METFNEARSVVIGDKRSVTVTGIFNERTGSFDLKPMFISSQPATVIADRREAIRKRAYFAAQRDRFKREPQEYWLSTESEFDYHLLHVVVRNSMYGYQAFMLPMDTVCGDGMPRGDTYLFAGNIPYVPRIDSIDFYRNWRHLHRFHVPRAVPQIKLNWLPGNEVPHGKQRVMWRGHHDEGRRLFYYLTHESANGKRASLTTLSETNEVEVDFSSLPSGVGNLVLTASDGYNTVATSSPRFYVPGRRCVASIFSPPDGAVLTGGRVELSGRGFYDDGTTEESEGLGWVSDRDGALGRGALVTGVLLSPGRHRISLTAGLPGAESSSSVQVEALAKDPGVDSSSFRDPKRL